MAGRKVQDSMGALEVPGDALWGAQTQRALQNFGIGGAPMPKRFVHALLVIKQCAARANHELGALDKPVALAIDAAVDELLADDYMSQFPVDVYQTGSGTSTNMNANEVVATLASRRAGIAVHPNDHVNLGQSSNDTIPSAIHVSARLALRDSLVPALSALARVIRAKGREYRHVTKTGRTHLMDALPLTVEQEFGAWASQIELAIERFDDVARRLDRIAQGGTAIGSGINCPPGFAVAFCRVLNAATGATFQPAGDRFAAIASQDTALEFSGALKVAATALLKIANDLRWMGSGPLAGLAEIELPALQPGSSIMPGKVNPVIAEAVAMAAVQVSGLDAAMTAAAQSGNFQLNVMLPLIASNLHAAIGLLANAATALADRAIAGLIVNERTATAVLARNPILVTALNPVIGYELGSKLAHRAYAEGRPVFDVAREMTDLDEAELKRLLDPKGMTGAD
jgi:fumarate hydratase class II